MPEVLPQSNQSLSEEPEIHVIPAEFYGGVRHAVSARLAASGGAGGASPSAAASAMQTSAHAPASAFVKKGINFKSPKIIIGGLIAFLVIVTGAFAWYYTMPLRNKNNITPPITEQLINNIAPPINSEPPVIATSTPPEAPTSTPPIEAPSSAIFPAKEYVKSADNDNDGLTNVEEALYKTDPNKPDTDGDGYLDGLEVENVYNPAGWKPMRIEETDLVKNYYNPSFHYSIVYPTSWLTGALDSNNEQVMFSSDTGEFMEVLAEDNPLKLQVKDWFMGQSPGTNPESLTAFVTKEKVEGLYSPDGLTAYVPYQDKIFVINYNIGLKAEINYLITFTMMVNSFKTVGEEAIISVPSATSTLQTN